MTPDLSAFGLQADNNCYGRIWSSEIGTVYEIALKDGPWITRRFDRSAYVGHWRLRIEIPGVLDLETDGPHGNGGYIFNGRVEIATGAGERALVELSDRLRSAEIAHGLTLGDLEDNELHRLHYLWPEVTESPDVPLWRP